MESCPLCGGLVRSKFAQCPKCRVSPLRANREGLIEASPRSNVGLVVMVMVVLAAAAGRLRKQGRVEVSSRIEGQVVIRTRSGSLFSASSVFDTSTAVYAKR